jgi:DNA repair ATPase RecN
VSQQANVTSTDAIQDFRSSLVVYVSKARPTLEEVGSEVLRLKMWLQNDQRMNLEMLMRRRYKELESAQSALASARIASLRTDTSAEQLAVQRAKRNLEEVETKLKRVKHWNREFDSQVEPLLKQLDKLHTTLSNDMVLAIAQLGRMVETLSAYADLKPTASATAPDAAPAAPPPAAPTEGAP